MRPRSKKPVRYDEYRGLSVNQLYSKLSDLQNAPNIRAPRYRDRDERIAFINSEIVLMTGRA